jgi:hypothetical protein
MVIMALKMIEIEFLEAADKVTQVQIELFEESQPEPQIVAGGVL